MSSRPIEDRVGWDETWMAVANVVAQRSRCIRDQVGAVIVTSRNRIVATGYNGPPAGFPALTTMARDDDKVVRHRVVRDCDQFCKRAMRGPTDETAHTYLDCPSLHAEANALAVADRSTFEGGTLYVSSGICHQCAKQISNSGLKRVVVSPRPGFEHREDDDSYTFLRLCGLHVDVLVP